MLLKALINLVMAVSLPFIAELSHADNNTSPDEIAGVTTIDAESLIQLAREIDDLVIIDSRIRSDRLQGFISSSISLPDIETSCSTLFHNIYRKNTPVVFYCNGPKCGRSHKALTIAKECGYTNLYWFRGGFEEWLNKQYIIHK